MRLGELFYYHRQYRNYSAAGMVPRMSCDTCDTLYYPRLVDDDLELWCMECDYYMQPGLAINNKVVQEVQKIER